jgi:hypothetical protein
MLSRAHRLGCVSRAVPLVGLLIAFLLLQAELTVSPLESYVDIGLLIVADPIRPGRIAKLRRTSCVASGRHIAVSRDFFGTLCLAVADQRSRPVPVTPATVLWLRPSDRRFPRHGRSLRAQVRSGRPHGPGDTTTADQGQEDLQGSDGLNPFLRRNQ